MQTEIILSGFGGQGALFAGMVLAHAGMEQGQYVTWIPSYGPEMRGGTAHVTVILSDAVIGSPLVQHPAVVLALNNPSMAKYEPLVKTEGVLVYNSSLIHSSPQRTDLSYVAVPANDIAAELDELKLANIVALGALVAATQVLPLNPILSALHHYKPELSALNEQALRRGAQLIKPLKVRTQPVAV
jgi:2-oxoglutarate ferredoxin oxidoreductase subunit gamma